MRARVHVYASCEIRRRDIFLFFNSIVCIHLTNFVHVGISVTLVKILFLIILNKNIKKNERFFSNFLHI